MQDDVSGQGKILPLCQVAELFVLLSQILVYVNRKYNDTYQASKKMEGSSSSGRGSKFMPVLGVIQMGFDWWLQNLFYFVCTENYFWSKIIRVTQKIYWDTTLLLVSLWIPMELMNARFVKKLNSISRCHGYLYYRCCSLWSSGLYSCRTHFLQFLRDLGRICTLNSEFCGISVCNGQWKGSLVPLPFVHPL